MLEKCFKIIKAATHHAKTEKGETILIADIGVMKFNPYSISVLKDASEIELVESLLSLQHVKETAKVKLEKEIQKQFNIPIKCNFKSSFRFEIQQYEFANQTELFQSRKRDIESAGEINGVIIFRESSSYFTNMIPTNSNTDLYCLRIYAGDYVWDISPALPLNHLAMFMDETDLSSKTDPSTLLFDSEKIELIKKAAKRYILPPSLLIKLAAMTSQFSSPNQQPNQTYGQYLRTGQQPGTYPQQPPMQNTQRPVPPNFLMANSFFPDGYQQPVQQPAFPDDLTKPKTRRTKKAD